MRMTINVPKCAVPKLIATEANFCNLRAFGSHFGGPKNRFISSVCDLWPLWPFVKFGRPVTCDRRIDLIGTVLLTSHLNDLMAQTLFAFHLTWKEENVAFWTFRLGWRVVLANNWSQKWGAVLINVKFGFTSVTGLFWSYPKSDSNVQNVVNIFSFQQKGTKF